METAIIIIGWLASICMIGGYLPQAIYTIRTRDTEGIALPTFLLMGFGSLFFVAQGILINNWPLAITNIITGASAAVITVIQLRNDARKRRNRAMASDVEKVAHQHPRNNQSQH